jgi:hypothetical protein
MAKHEGLTSAEQEAIGDDSDADTEIAAIKALANKLDKDDDDDQATGATGTADDDAAATAAAAAGSTKDDAAGAGDQANDEATDIVVAEPFTATLPTGDVSKYEEERSALLDERKALRAKHKNGELAEDDFEAAFDDVTDRIGRLDTAHAVAQSQAASNESLGQQKWLWTVGMFKQTLRDQGGIDYDANDGARSIWDHHVKALAAKDENRTKPGNWFLSEAHKLTLRDIRATAESLGMKAGAPATPAPAPAPGAVKAAVDARRPKVDATPSLANVPTSGAADDGAASTEFAYLDSLSGMALERALAKLPEEARDRWLEAR